MADSEPGSEVNDVIGQVAPGATTAKHYIGFPHGWYTFESDGLVENLSLLSPFSSKRSTTRSAVQTASLVLFGAQAIAVIFAAPSWM